MNKIISSIQWLEAFSVNGVPLADIALLVTWLCVFLLSLGVQWPFRNRKAAGPVPNRDPDSAGRVAKERVPSHASQIRSLQSEMS